jgi:hypothetical protein
MPSELGRRSLVAGALGGLCMVATGGYAWNQYATRSHLQFRPLEAVNESDEPVTITVTVRSDRRDGYERTADLATAGDEEETRTLPGPWIKSPEAYSVHAATDGEELHLENPEIVDRLGDADWGRNCVRVTIVVTEESRLESRVVPSDRC